MLALLLEEDQRRVQVEAEQDQDRVDQDRERAEVTRAPGGKAGLRPTATKAAAAPVVTRRALAVGISGVGRLTVAVLKERLSSFGLSTDGLKGELVARLNNALAAAPTAGHATEPAAAPTVAPSPKRRKR